MDASPTGRAPPRFGRMRDASPAREPLPRPSYLPLPSRRMELDPIGDRQEVIEDERSGGSPRPAAWPGPGGTAAPG